MTTTVVLPQSQAQLSLNNRLWICSIVSLKSSHRVVLVSHRLTMLGLKLALRMFTQLLTSHLSGNSSRRKRKILASASPTS